MCPAICKLCYDNLSVPLRRCVISTHGWSPGNCEGHIKSTHSAPELAPVYTEHVEKKSRSNSTKLKAASAGFFGQSTIPQLSADDTVKEVDKLLYRFFNTANISMNQSNNVYLHELLQLLISKGHVFKPGTSNKIAFSTYRYKVQEIKSFTTFTNFVTNSIAQSRKYYIEQTGKKIPFLSIGHDGWDSKRRDILGVTVHFVHPIHWVTITLPVGLKYLTSKKSVDMAEQINKVLSR